jgi:opacity protein-like surface antigen
LSGSWDGASDNSDCFVNHPFIRSTNVSCSTRQKWTAQLLARFGYAPGDGRFLPYILGGLAMTELNAVKQLTATGAPSGNIAAWSTGPWGGTATHEGVALGVGAQYAVSPWVSFGLDYVYALYGTQDHSGFTSFTSFYSFGSNSGVSLFNAPQNLRTQSARFVLNVRLD